MEERLMDELRVVRREEQALIVATDSGEEFRLEVDASVLADLRHLARQSSEGPRISPRKIQALVRAGKGREEIMEITGAEEIDIERYEEPVLAERRFVLENAHNVAVRTSPAEDSEEKFGAVIAERLIGLSAQEVHWRSWRDDDAGWMVGLAFDSHGASHNAVWSFDHRKGMLSPVTPDAVTLSKQGDVGDRLIPKLRAVDDAESRDRFDSDAFNHDDLATESNVSDANTEASSSGMSPGAEAAVRARHPSTGSIPIVDVEDEFARRREIDQRAISTPADEQPELGQTADLLDALRRRRGAREDAKLDLFEQDSEPPIKPAQPVPLRGLSNEIAAQDDDSSVSPDDSARGADDAAKAPREAPAAPDSPRESGKRGKGRRSIPSWDDILFGTRSEEDPL